MANELATTNDKVSAEVMEQVIASGDLINLTPAQRVQYYVSVCDSLGLNWRTKPFDYLMLGDKKDEQKLVLYAKKDATDQLRGIRHISVNIVNRERMGDVYVVTARATTQDGRIDEATGVVSIVKEGGEWKTAQTSNKRYFAGDGKWADLRGNDMANALMKAETKAKRRVTLSICGLGWTDESEIETIPNARPAVVNMDTGEIVDAPRPTVTVVTPGNGHTEPTRTRQPWVDDPRAIRAFMEAAMASTALSSAEILSACKVSDMSEYIGTKADAKEDINAWIAKNTTEIETEPEPLALQM